MSPNLPTSFWSRMGLREEDRDDCVRAVECLYPDSNIEESRDQGYCSFTLAVSPSATSEYTNIGERVVQIRPRQHYLDIDIADAAWNMYGGLAARVRELTCTLPGDLKAVEMERLTGVPLSQIDVERGTWEQQATLVQSFAQFIAMAWPNFASYVSSRYTRADTPTQGQWLEQRCTGRVGRVLIPKLCKLAAHLPDELLRARVRDTLAHLLTIEEYPVVLNHGDLIPSNILVDPGSWRVTGLVDWAEAEWLPFGTCLYGLEHLLGSLVVGGGGKPLWRYREGSEQLRRVFWEALEREKREVGEWREEVECMRDVGVLLWYGYAWDEGAIDRIVNEANDAEEIACLRAFLDVT